MARNTLDFTVGARSRGPADYEGVVRKGGEVLWACRHHHNGTSALKAAMGCVTERVRATRDGNATASDEHAAEEWTRQVSGLAWLIGDRPVYGADHRIIVPASDAQ